MNDNQNNPSLWRSADRKEFFLIGDEEAKALTAGGFVLENGEGKTVAVERRAVDPFAIEAGKVTALLEGRINEYAEAILQIKKDLQLLPGDAGKAGTEEMTAKIREYLQSDEAKASAR